MLFSMRRRTQLYRWLEEQAGRRGGIVDVVRGLFGDARRRRSKPARDPFVRYLLDEPPSQGEAPSTVTTLDQDIYAR